MKDPRYTEAWVDALALRIQRGQITPPRESVLPPDEPLVIDPPAVLHYPRVYTRADAAALAAMPPTCKVTRSSPNNLIAIRSLSRAASILLFTPAVIPNGQTKTMTKPPIDPFEAFGRALSKHHKRIRHVPFVPKIGFTAIHEAFISQADAVITVVCEPEEFKHESMSNQMDFAESALDALEGKEANAKQSFVLVQCGQDEFRPPIDATFENVVESMTYDAEIAKHIANAIFRARI